MCCILCELLHGGVHISGKYYKVAIQCVIDFLKHYTWRDDFLVGEKARNSLSGERESSPVFGG